MKIVRKILKYFFMILINVIWLFGLKMVLPVEDSSSNAKQQNTIVYTNEI